MLGPGSRPSSRSLGPTRGANPASHLCAEAPPRTSKPNQVPITFPTPGRPGVCPWQCLSEPPLRSPRLFLTPLVLRLRAEGSEITMPLPGKVRPWPGAQHSLLPQPLAP